MIFNAIMENLRQIWLAVVTNIQYTSIILILILVDICTIQK